MSISFGIGAGILQGGNSSVSAADSSYDSNYDSNYDSISQSFSSIGMSGAESQNEVDMGGTEDDGKPPAVSPPQRMQSQGHASPSQVHAPPSQVFQNQHYRNTHSDSSLDSSSFISQTPSSIAGPEEDDDDRVEINVSESDSHRLYHFMNPESIQYNTDCYSPCSLKVPPCFKTEKVKAYVSEVDQTKAIIEFPFPAKAMNPRFILGTNLDESHVLYQAVQNEINRLQIRSEERPAAKLVIDLPFVAEMNTSNDLFQDSGKILKNAPMQKKASPHEYSTTAAFVFKEKGNAFHVSSKLGRVTYKTGGDGGTESASAGGDAEMSSASTTNGNKKVKYSGT